MPIMKTGKATHIKLLGTYFTLYVVINTFITYSHHVVQTIMENFIIMSIQYTSGFINTLNIKIP